MIEERYELAMGRIHELRTEDCLQKKYTDFFQSLASFLCLVAENYECVKSSALYQESLEQLQERNRALYADILSENYEKSYGNPTYCADCFGIEYGQLLCFLYAELRSTIPCAYEQQLEPLVIRLELFLEIYGAFTDMEEQRLPVYEELRQILYWYLTDYSEMAAEAKIKDLVDPEENFAVRLIMESDLTDLRYLYYFGEYISENEYETAQYLLTVSQETLCKMADTFSEGYRMGFVLGNKDLSRKKTVCLEYSLGFERMIKRAITNFEKLNLKPTLYRSPVSVLQGKGVNRRGYFGGTANKQYDYDHKEDQALVLDHRMMQRKLETLKEALELYKSQAAEHGGPAVVEVFGAAPMAPVNKPEALQLSEKQQQLTVEYMTAAGNLQNEYLKGEERSFTIIAFPTPEIGPQFPQIFDEIIRINTLDYMQYRSIQQTLIDTLDQGEYVIVRGMGANKTNIRIHLHPITDGRRQTKFENCVADVNIPVGEVFTSPVLTGTEGALHVTGVYLNELYYQNLNIQFKDGKIVKYSCDNFEAEAENQKQIKDHILFHHETLPMGEFAIGTNTTAYRVSRKYHLEDKLPILIAEKMGPHFAVGDTCYSHAEDVAVFNPDGKEIIARDNEISITRKEGGNAYFNCHTDITIPYDELGEISVVTADDHLIPIIIEGKFVLPGCEELNIPL